MTNRKLHHRVLLGLLAAYLPVSLVSSLGMVMCHDANGEMTLETVQDTIACCSWERAESSSSELQLLDGGEGPCSDVRVGMALLAAPDSPELDAPPAVANNHAGWSRSATVAMALVASRLARDADAGPSIHPTIQTTVLLI